MVLVIWLMFVCTALAQYDPAGAYVSVQGPALRPIAHEISSEATSEWNAMSYKVPDQSGKTSSASYTFSTFDFENQLYDFFWKNAGGDILQFGWNDFDLWTTFLYHVCATQWPNPCEDGKIQISTTTKAKKQILVEGTLDLVGADGTFAYDKTELNYPGNYVRVNAICSDSICLIPPGDIADGVYDQLASVANTVMAKIIAKIEHKYLPKMNWVFKLEKFGTLEFVGGSRWYDTASSEPDLPNLVLGAYGGMYADVNGQYMPPPFKPSTTVPASVFAAPPEAANLYLTDFFFSTVVWAMGEIGVFTQVIDNSTLPSHSPIMLQTNDTFFLSAVPGLTEYPDCMIQISTKLEAFAQTTVTTNGVNLAGNLITMGFVIYNTSWKALGWTLSVNLNLDMDVDVALSGKDLQFTPKFSNIAPVINVTQTMFQNISTAPFASVFQLLSAAPFPKFSVTTPKVFDCTAATASWATGYLAVELAGSFINSTMF